LDELLHKHLETEQNTKWSGQRGAAASVRAAIMKHDNTTGHKRSVVFGRLKGGH